MPYEYGARQVNLSVRSSVIGTRRIDTLRFAHWQRASPEAQRAFLSATQARPARSNASGTCRAPLRHSERASATRDSPKTCVRNRLLVTVSQTLAETLIEYDGVQPKLT